MTTSKIVTSKTLAAVIVASDKALAAAKVKGASLSDNIRAVLSMPDTQAAALLTEALNTDLVAAIVGATKKGATVDSTGADWHRMASVVCALARRLNKGTPGAAPRFGLCYIGLNKAEKVATVAIIAKPTTAQVKEALHGDPKAQSAALAALAQGKAAAGNGNGKGKADTAAPVNANAKLAGSPDKTKLGAYDAEFLAMAANWSAADIEATIAKLAAIAAGKKAAIAASKAAAISAADTAKKAAAKVTGRPVQISAGAKINTKSSAPVQKRAKEIAHLKQA